MTKQNLAEVLQFCVDNDLDEVILEKSQNYFAQKDVVKKLPEVKKTVTDDLPNWENLEKNLAFIPSGYGNAARAAPRLAGIPIPHVNETYGKNFETTKTISAAQSFIKPQFSTNEALSTLAKKQQNIAVNSAAEISDQKFIPLNEIVARAEKLAKGAKNLAELRKVVENFDGCNLKKMATNTVFCDGNPNSKIMVIGEAPGNHEDLQGIPFCGDSGKVLDGMFRGINMTREKNFYITNVIFWRPPGNRRPTEEELAICRPFVERHIQLLNPEVIVLVGATSMTAVLGITDPISSVCGQFMDYAPKFLSRKIKSFTIFHPSYLMRQSAKKKLAWQDMLALEQFLSLSTTNT